MLYKPIVCIIIVNNNVFVRSDDRGARLVSTYNKF